MKKKKSEELTARPSKFLSRVVGLESWIKQFCCKHNATKITAESGETQHETILCTEYSNGRSWSRLLKHFCTITGCWRTAEMRVEQEHLTDFETLVRFDLYKFYCEEKYNPWTIQRPGKETARVWNHWLWNIVLCPHSLSLQAHPYWKVKAIGQAHNRFVVLTDCRLKETNCCVDWKKQIAVHPLIQSVQSSG